MTAESAPGSNRPRRRHQLAMRAALGAGVLFILVSLAPYPIVGEYWGMAWYYIAAPFSGPLKEPLWDFSVTGYVVVTTLVAALAWAAAIYVSARVILRFANVA